LEGKVVHKNVKKQHYPSNKIDWMLSGSFELEKIFVRKEVGKGSKEAKSSRREGEGGGRE
jgi:hypothetical protein